MNARAPKEVSATVALIANLRESIDQAQVGASWGNDRIAPLLAAVKDLSRPDNPGALAARMDLIGKLAMLGLIAIDEMAADFETTVGDAEAKLAALEGGIQ